MNKDEALQVIRNNFPTGRHQLCEALETLIPELKESDDEKMRAWLIEYFDKVNDEISKDDRQKIIAWLGKQEQKLIRPIWKYKKDHTSLLRDSFILNKYGCVGKSPSGALVSDVWVLDFDELAKLPKEEIEKQVGQKPVDKVEPKFKVGDWIISSEGMLRHILAVDKTGYQTDYGWLTHDIYDNTYHLWTIQYAKDGDVLCCENGWTCIFKSLDSNSFSSYCFMDCSEWFCELGGECHSLNENLCGKIHPATKEQRDLLFQEMKEAGYEWDSEKKELKKIEQKPEIKDDVLSRFAFYQYDDDAIYLSSLFVRESDREHGYGSKVLKAAEEVAKTFGVSKIRLKVERNTWMEKWYKKNGYEYLSSEGKYDWLENRVIDIKPDKIELKE